MTLRFATTIFALHCALVLATSTTAKAEEPSTHPVTAQPKVKPQTAPVVKPQPPKIVSYDWVPHEQLTPEQKAKLGPACSGAYIDPLAKAPITDPATTPISVEAQTSDMSATQITLNGDVEIEQGARQIHAQKMHYNRETGDAGLEGGVEIRQPGVWVGGNRAHVNMAGNEAEFDGGKFVLHDSHLRGQAGNIQRKASGVVVLQDGKITSCEPHSDSWELSGSKLTINPNTRQGSGRNVTLRVADIPIFYAPYLTFPVGSDRQSGLLVPVIGTSEGGLDLALPVYLNLAPNLDATIAPRYAEGHGILFEGETRYLNRWSYNTLTLAYLSNDDGDGDPDLTYAIDNNATGSDLRTYQGENRWLLDFQHTGGDASRWYSDMEYSKVSDIDYFRDLAVASFDVANNTYLSQGFLFGYRLPNWHLQLRLQDYQSLLADVDDAYRQSPRLTATAKYPLKGLEFSLNQEYVRFAHTDPRYVEGDRFNLDYQLNWNKHWSFGFINPNFGLQALAYNLKDDNLSPTADDRPSFVTPYASVDAGLVFERNGGEQTLEPRLFYLYRQYDDQSSLYDVTDAAFGPTQGVNFDTTPLTFGYHQLFRKTRFSGGDRLDDADQLTLSLTSHWESVMNTGMALDVSFGQIFYFNDRQVQLSRSTGVSLEESDLAAQVTLDVANNVRIHSDLLYDPKSKQVMRSSNGVEYRDGDDRLLNVGYRYVRDTQTDATLPVDQLDTSFAWPVGAQWQIVGRVFYDLDASKELDTFVGFEYDDCCYRMRLLARRWLDSKLAALVNDEKRHYDEALFLEIDLKGLASSGESIKQLLARSIPGYRP